MQVQPLPNIMLTHNLETMTNCVNLCSDFTRTANTYLLGHYENGGSQRMTVNAATRISFLNSNTNYSGVLRHKMLNTLFRRGIVTFLFHLIKVYSISGV